MAQKNEFTYHDIELYKSESLGSGSFGWVCKAKCDGLLCAAKIMHSTLCDLHSSGADSSLPKFQEECRLLSLGRHPNVVQYLASYNDPNTELPVLIMELCDESLTTFLERSPGPLSYHIQINICHDIALALVYLHSNGLIHRDLTGNNVLMIAGTRAKITDFGMSKLATVNPRMTALTLCPGNLLYMSPEALDEAKSYTAKLDNFSFGVIVIQILTRQLPNPSDRFCLVQVPQFEEPLRQLVPETERRQSQLKLIPDTHSLKPVVLDCLKKEGQRPSAVELSERLSELKQSSQYTESQSQTHSSSDIQQLQQQLRLLTEANTKEVEMKERELQRTQQRLQASKQLVSEFQQSLQQKDQIISDLQQTILVHERKNQQLEQQPLQQTVTGPQTTAKKDISKMTWKEEKSAPERMKGGAAVVHGNTAYFKPAGSCTVYSYQIIGEEEQWSQLPDNDNRNCGLAVIKGLVTSVGGYNNANAHTSTLLSLTGEGERNMWSEIFPPMPTRRSSVACITTEQALVVAGGHAVDYLKTVEVMNINTKQWTTVSPLPQCLSELSGHVCGNTFYVKGRSQNENYLFACSIPELIATNKFGFRIRRKISESLNVWTKKSSLAVPESTFVSFSGDLLAIGGKDGSYKSISDVYRYDSQMDSWNIVSHMKNKRSQCLAATLPGDRIVVVGCRYSRGDSVEIFE